MRAFLALEDGRIFEGESFGATGTRAGEVCFNTSMTGYQEVLTDPSYRGQIVAMTYPLIGNYGTNAIDQESTQPHVRGVVIEELSQIPSNWRAEEPLDDYLRRWEIPGVQGIDTRALTRHLRTRGAMKACLSTEITAADEAVRCAITGEGVIGMDYVREVTTPNIFQWDPDDQLSGKWPLQSGDQVLPPIRHRIVAFDYGMKRNILRSLRQRGFGVTVVPASTSAEEVLALNPNGVFLSNGPGDPEAVTYAPDRVRAIADRGVPIFGICLGHQILGLTYGGHTVKMPYGHRGGNHPVKELSSGKVLITSQNHGFAVTGDERSVAGAGDLEVTHV